MQALTEALDAAGYQLILGQAGYDHSREDALLNTMISRRPDGIVLTGLLHSHSARERLRRLGIPVVETWDLSDRPVDMVVGFSHLKVGSAIAGYFLGKGWQRLGIATADDHRASMRRDGFLSVVGHDVPTAVVPAPSGLEVGRRALGELLQKDPLAASGLLQLGPDGAGRADGGAGPGAPDPRTTWRSAASAMPPFPRIWIRR